MECCMAKRNKIFFKRSRWILERIFYKLGIILQQILDNNLALSGNRKVYSYKRSWQNK